MQNLCQKLVRVLPIALTAFALNAVHHATQAQALGDPLVIRLGVREDAFPFSFKSANRDAPKALQFRGYAVDLCLKVVEELRKKHSLSFNADKDIEWVVVTPRTRALKLLAGELDLECGSTSNTASRRALGIDFSPTYFISKVGLLVSKDRQQPTRSFKDLVSRARDKSVPFVATAGSNSVQHIYDFFRSLDLSKGKNFSLTLGDTHIKSYAVLVQNAAQAFVLDEVLLQAALATNQKLRESFELANWSIAPHARECYALMVRKDKIWPAGEKVDPSQFSQTVREVVLALRRPSDKGQSFMQQRYEYWFQNNLSAADRPIDSQANAVINLSLPPSQELARVLISARMAGECD